MAEFRMRPLGHSWSPVTLPDGPDEKEQLLSLFSRALETVPELSGLPQGVDEYDVFWDRDRVTIYHASVEDQPVFRAEPSRSDAHGQVRHCARWRPGQRGRGCGAARAVAGRGWGYGFR